MKITSFRASSVYGHLNFDLAFHSDLNILIGANGSGKTTVLKMITYLLTPSLSRLSLIPFKTVEVDLIPKHSDRVVTLRADNTSKSMIITILGASGIDPLRDKCVVPIVHMSDESKFIGSDLRASLLAKSIWDDQSNTKVYSYLEKLASPYYVGLDRNFEDDQPARLAGSTAELLGMKISNNTSVGSKNSIEELQSLLSKEYKRLKDIEAGRANKLRKEIVISAFQFSEFAFEDDFATDGQALKDRYQALLDREHEIRGVIASIEVDSKDVIGQVDVFFKKLKKSYERIGKGDSDLSLMLDWLVHKAQIERITSLLKVIDENKDAVAALYAKTNLFLRRLNLFLVDSGKVANLNKVGQLVIESASKDLIPLNLLSSGEIQIICLLGQLFFRRDRHIFIIDEPELSLHVRWQRRFVESACEAQRSNQLILATHSPEIVGKYKSHAISVRGR
ncbi:AAA family ATPase [Frateuria aurantia]|uniref:Endonuclease GajA/Old nuclease/RecF-like AAA domain-containing protein n=1 Tax=Frateuria aurantia (strain ATCC 33424 / DSM 6220 / KCTC 2777 / LMG 1558 / NBRC 3245 / NCIMB 13370) TaxID=767434 RepID=H8L2A1_FRAAD|nr:AAA family ATPase [Frateuria aurantia]AFC84735.1 hypothetical protein Fraau_0239 [Frateuria aurantia DSM 6220]